jgi:hypothetical protein
MKFFRKSYSAGFGRNPADINIYFAQILINSANFPNNPASFTQNPANAYFQVGQTSKAEFPPKNEKTPYP